MVEGGMDSSNSRTAPPQYTEKAGQMVGGTMDSSDTKTAALSTAGLMASSLLDPSLQFNIITIEENLDKADREFAKAVVGLISERAYNGIFARDCWGYRYLSRVLNLRLYHSNIRTNQGMV